MSEKKKNNGLYSMWYDISNEIGKQIMDISTIGNLDYSVLQKSWQGYSEKMNQQFSKFMDFDDNYYKNMVTLWKEFTETMNSNVIPVNVYEKTDYNKWYESWLEYSDKISNDFSEALQQNIKKQTELYEDNDLWFNKFGFNEEQRQQLKEFSSIVVDYWLEVINKTTETFQETCRQENSSEYLQKFKELSEYWTESYSNMVERLMNTKGFEKFKDYDLNHQLSGWKMIQQFYNNNLRNFGLNNGADLSLLSEELEKLKSEVNKLSSELDGYQKKGSSKKK
jgi:hypothetical protein